MNLTDEAAKAAAGVHGAISIRICNNKGKYEDLRGTVLLLAESSEIKKSRGTFEKYHVVSYGRLSF
jgi:hypothetical protein